MAFNTFLNGSVKKAALETDVQAAIPKAWGELDLSNTPTITNSFNVASVTKQSNYIFRVTFINPMPTSTYAVTLGCVGSALNTPNTYGAAIQGSNGAGVSNMTADYFEIIYGQTGTTTSKYVAFSVG